MSPMAGILLLLSAITHAGWNFLSKRQHPTLAFYFRRLSHCLRMLPAAHANPSQFKDAGKNVIEGYVVSNMYIGAIIRYTIAVGDQMVYVDEVDPQYCGILQNGDKA